MKFIILALLFTIVILLYFLFSNIYELYIKKHPQKDDMEFYNTYERKYDREFNYSSERQRLNEQKLEDIKNLFPECLRFFGFTDFPTEKELKDKYREMAKKCHPDRGGDPEEFRKVNQNYEEALKIIKIK